MRRFLLSSFGSSGDMNPVLAVAARLVARGADVRFVANPIHAGRVARTGARFVPAGERFDVFSALEADRRYLDPVRGGPRIWRELVLPSIRDIYPAATRSLAEEPADRVVAHCLSFGAMWAAEARGIPYVTLTPTPFGWISEGDPSALADRELPRAFQPFSMRVLRWGMSRAFGAGQAALARELGHPGGAGLDDVAARAEANLGLWSTSFRAPAADDPPRSRICGFTFGEDAEAPLQPELDAFLAEGEAPVVVAFGSAAIAHADSLFAAAAGACERLGRRCVLVGVKPGAVPDRPGQLSVAAAPYAKLFPAAALVVHHGGMGTCAEAMRAERPAIVTPFAFDQFDTACRAERAGVARWAHHRDRSAHRLAELVHAALGDPALLARTREVAAALRAEGDGAENASALMA